MMTTTDKDTIKIFKWLVKKKSEKSFKIISLSVLLIGFRAMIVSLFEIEKKEIDKLIY